MNKKKKDRHLKDNHGNAEFPDVSRNFVEAMDAFFLSNLRICNGQTEMFGTNQAREALSNFYNKNSRNKRRIYYNVFFGGGSKPPPPPPPAKPPREMNTQPSPTPATAPGKSASTSAAD